MNTLSRSIDTYCIMIVSNIGFQKKLHKVIYFDKYQFTYFPTLNIRNKDTGMSLRLKYVPLGGRTERIIANWIKSKSTE